jgi:hypothetical protein
LSRVAYCYIFQQAHLSEPQAHIAISPMPDFIAVKTSYIAVYESLHPAYCLALCKVNMVIDAGTSFAPEGKITQDGGQVLRQPSDKPCLLAVAQVPVLLLPATVYSSCLEAFSEFMLRLESPQFYNSLSPLLSPLSLSLTHKAAEVSGYLSPPLRREIEHMR